MLRWRVVLRTQIDYAKKMLIRRYLSLFDGF